MTWELGITEEQFDQLYGNTIDKDPFTREPFDDEDLIESFLTSKLWRMNNLYSIVDKKGQRIIFKMNYAQHVVYAASLQHPRLIILKSRQQGISTFWLICFLDDALIYGDYNIGMLAQGQSEAGTLLKRVGLAWESLAPEIKSFLGLSLARDNAAEQGFSNNSTIFIRTSFRSATLQRLHISEYGKIAKTYPERARETKTGTLQAIQPGNTVVIESTAEGDNEFKWTWETALAAEARVQRLGLPAFAGEDFKPVFLSWVNDPDCWQEELEEASLTQEAYFHKIAAETGVELKQQQKNFWIAKYRTLGEDIYQEYPATPEEAFTKANDGAYYSVLYLSYVVRRGRIVPQLYDENLEVYVFMDLGMNDTFTIGYVQRFREEWRIINEYTNSGEGLEHYVKHMFATGYSIAQVICPHDIMVRELGIGMSRLDRLRELGVRNAIVLPKLGIEAGIERVRALIPDIWIDEKCTYLQGCFANYSKDWDDRLQTWKSSPRHDKWSHGADVLRYMAVSHIGHTDSRTKETVARVATGVVDGMAI